MIDIDPERRPDLWRGAVAWQADGSWRQPWRLPPERETSAYAPELFARAKAPAGVRAQLITDATGIGFELESSGEEPSPLDLIIDGELSERVELRTGRNPISLRLPGRTASVEVWLPQFGPARLTVPTLDGGTSVEPASTTPARRWLCYGSSITHCRTADGPTETWPALLARTRGWDLTCLGFGGQCHLDPVVLDAIGGREVDLISLCLGINVYGSASYNARTWRARLADFLINVRERQPAVPIMVISPIASPDREATPNAVGLTLADYRAGVHEVVEDLIRAGEDRLHVINGTTILGTDEASLLPDGLHPGPKGYRIMAERIGQALDEFVETVSR